MARPETSAAARSVRQWPLLIVVVGAFAGLAVAMIGDSTWRWGGYLVGASLLVGALERVILPDRQAGLLEVRSKPFDVAVLALAGLAILVLSYYVPEGRR